MSEIAAMIAHMEARGNAPEAILEAVKALVAAKDSAIEERRAADRVRKARSRAAQRVPLNINGIGHVTVADSTDTPDSADKNPPPLSSPPFPSPKPLTKTPPIIPPTDEITGARNSKTVSAKGSRLDPSWTLPDDWLTDANSIAFKAKQPLSEQEIRNEVDKFRDYWTAKPGAGGRKSDWRGTWRNWVRSYLDRRKPRNAPGSYGAVANGQHGGGSIADAAIRRRLQRENGIGFPGDGGQQLDLSPESGVIDGDYRRIG